MLILYFLSCVLCSDKVITQQVALQMASLSLVGTDSSPAFLEFISLPHSTSRITIDRAVKWTFNEDIVLSISPLEFYTSAEKASFHSLRIQGNFYYKNQPQWMLWQQENYWQQPVDWSDNSISTCGGISMLGGYGKFAGGEVQKTFVEVPKHSKVRIVANYHFIDGWGGETGFMRVSIGRMDGMEYVWTEKYDYSKVKNGISVCGSRYPEGRLTSVIDVSFPHTKDTLKLGFGSTLDNDPLENSFGMSNLLPEIEQCNSRYSTCCSNYSDHDETDDPLNISEFKDFETILPITINNVKILKITWDHFSAPPNVYSIWKAHCYWTVGYTYDITMKKMKKSNNIRYRLLVNAWCCLSTKSWVKNKWNRLLEHETGHYLIGCLCALEYKLRAEKTKFTKNYRLESTKLFQDTFQEYLILERKYDLETNHSQNIDKQKEWNEFIKRELQKY